MANSPKDNGSPQAEDFYASALTEAERVRLRTAKSIEGLDQEIALLRLRLHGLAQEHPEDVEKLRKGVETLVKAVALKYRLSRKAEKDLYENLVGVLRGIGGALWPEAFDGL